jgi:hypothetical protein
LGAERFERLIDRFAEAEAARLIAFNERGRREAAFLRGYYRNAWCTALMAWRRARFFSQTKSPATSRAIENIPNVTKVPSGMRLEFGVARFPVT